MISWVAMDNMPRLRRGPPPAGRLVSKAFTPRRTEAIRPQIEALTNKLLDGLAAVGPDEVVDLRERFAFPLPGMLVADLIGMDEHARAATAKVIHMMVDTTVTPTSWSSSSPGRPHGRTSSKRPCASQWPLASAPMRYAVEDIDLGEGVMIPKGDPILVNFAATGRDPSLHGESAPDFDITRADKEHLSFGHGPHFCLGAGFARLVATIGLSTLSTGTPT